MKIFTNFVYNYYIKPFVYLLYVCMFSHVNIHLLLYFIRNNYYYNNQNKYIKNTIITNTETNLITNIDPIKFVVEIPDIVENKMGQEHVANNEHQKNINTNVDKNDDDSIDKNDDDSIDKNDYDYITISPEKCIIQKYFSKKWLKKFFYK